MFQRSFTLTAYVAAYSLHHLIPLAFATAHPTKDATPVLITGATGRTGALLYFELLARGVPVRALVRSADRARAVLGCHACNDSEGIYVGDVTDLSSILPAAKGVTTVAIAVGVSGTDGADDAEIRAVEFDGVRNTAAALSQSDNRGVPEGSLRIVLISSMGTMSPNPSFGGNILFWKLNAEAFLGSLAIGSTVVKPCGLTDGPAGNDTLITGHDDVFLEADHTVVTRSDVARVVAEVVVERSKGLRFDLCARNGPVTNDLVKLIEGSKRSWEYVTDGDMMKLGEKVKVK